MPEWVNRVGRLLVQSVTIRGTEGAVVVENPPEERSLEDQQMERFVNALGRGLIRTPRRPTVNELLLMDGRVLDAAMERMRRIE